MGALAVAASVACGVDDADAGGGAVVRDSAGVRIVEGSGPREREGEGPRVRAEPGVVIGAHGGPVDLHRVSDATRLPDGTIVVADGGAAALLFFGPDGTHLRSAGTRGRGPGEFRTPTWLTVRGDTLFVFDPFQDNGRVSLFTLTGDFLSSERLEVEGLPYVSPDVLLPDGRYLDLFSEGSLPPTEEGHVVYTRQIVAYGRGPTAPDTLVRGVPGAEVYRERFGNGMSQTWLPFGRDGYTAVGSERVWVGDGARFVIDGYTLEGDHVVSIRMATEEPEVGEAEVERWLETTLAAPGYERRPDAAARLRDRVARMQIPARMPAYDELRVDALERLWVRRYAPPWERRNEWWVFEADGQPLGAVELPPGLRVLEIGADRLLGAATDELDVERVEVYGIAEGPP